MKNQDNATPHPSARYDDLVRDTIPYYDLFHEETINLVKAAQIRPKIWLDTGCGTGSFVVKALKAFPETRFLLADPSGAMLDQAKKKLATYSGKRVSFLDPVGTQDISPNLEKTDIVTAIQCHHYLSNEGRIKATKKCYDILRSGGMYVSFENIRPFSSKGVVIGKEYWKNFQLSRGRDLEEVEKHMARFDAEYFPLTIEEHLTLLRKTGFRTVEMLWYSYMQTGFYCIKD